MQKKKEIILDGNNFNDLQQFYDEIERKLTKGLKMNKI